MENLEKLKSKLVYLKVKTNCPFFNFFYQKFLFRRKSIFSQIFSFFLVPFSLVYLLLIKLKKIFTSKEKLTSKIISVGNIIAGGAGKTSVVVYLLKILYNRKKIGVVIGKRIKDEAELIRKNFPFVLVSNEKNLNGLRGIDNFCDLIIIDDGFHCNWIKKDIDILVIDCFNPFDNKFLIPAGLLREPLSSVKRADIIILSHPYMVTEEGKLKIVNYFKKINKPLFFMDFKIKELKNGDKNIPVEFLENKRILAFAGIGNPFNFFYLILYYKPQILYSISYPDHYSYKKEDIEVIEKIAEEKMVDIVLTTEKDFIKIENFVKNAIFYYPVIDINFKSIEDSNFDNLIEKIIK
jgi:tetraacyldisaccharide 4'-kinase